MFFTLLPLSTSIFAPKFITAEKNNLNADLCFYKQIKIQGYLYANLVGRCALDIAMNGMQLSVTAVLEAPKQDAHIVQLGIVRDVNTVSNKAEQLQLSATEDVIDSNGHIA